MSVTRCPNGHFYDSDKNSSCPWCGAANLDNDLTRNIPMAEDDTEKTVAATNHIPAPADDGGEGKTVSLSASQTGTSAVEGATVAIIRKKTGIDPVVGWLVCVKGAEKGRDYRIHSEKNTIGRSDSMDIVIKGDETISRASHAFLMHNPKKNTFRITNGEGRGLIYVNGDDVSTYIELKPYDLIEMGESAFIFIPFCSDKFSWNEDGKKEEA